MPASGRSTNSLEALTAWRQQRLILRHTPLPEAVAEINRYNATQPRIGDPSLASLLVNGVFRTGAPDSFVLALEATLPVRARTTPGRDRILPRAETLGGRSPPSRSPVEGLRSAASYSYDGC